MARINSKSKGAGFEGTVAKKLGLALDPLKFIRSPGSGARVGGKNFETFGAMFGAEAMKIFTADVVPTNEKEAGVTFKHSIECKSYKESDSFETMIAGNANLFKWMNESIVDGAKTGNNPLIIFKWNRTPIYVGGLHGTMPAHPRLQVAQNGMTIDLFYLDDLLADKSFWVS